ncbi:DUF5082 domain-containing protein [Staphylococcus epidermidis]|nr:DUF5082 domain-containing protein [Staphylococcus epidermidis]
MKAKIADLNDKIERATRVKIKLTELKKNVKEHKVDVKNIFKEYTYWKGENNSKWEKKSENELIVGSMSNCIKNIDENIDRLIDKITEMQNEVNSLGSILSILDNAINSIASAIEKITN